MKEMSHTQGKLATNADRIESEKEHGWANDGWIIAKCEGPDAFANARRLVACWNALEGVPTEWLENYVFRSVENVIQENAALKAENEKLREEIKNVERAEVFPVPAKDEKLREVTKEFVRAYDRGDPVVLINTIEKMREALEGK